MLSLPTDSLLQVFKEPLECRDKRGNMLVTHEDLKCIFGNVADILAVHKSMKVSCLSFFLVCRHALSRNLRERERREVTCEFDFLPCHAALACFLMAGVIFWYLTCHVFLLPLLLRMKLSSRWRLGRQTAALAMSSWARLAPPHYTTYTYM